MKIILVNSEILITDPALKCRILDLILHPEPVNKSVPKLLSSPNSPNEDGLSDFG